MKLARKMLSLLLMAAVILSINIYNVAAATSENTERASEAVTANEDEYPDIIAVDFTEYTNEIVNGRNTAVLDFDKKDGRTVLKVTPNPESTESTSVVVDGYKYTSAKVHLGIYKWFALEYYYESENPLTNLRMRFSIMPTGGALFPQKSATATAQSYVSANKWDIAIFDMGTPLATTFNPDTENPYLYQMHTYPYGASNLNKLSENDVMYISKIMFFKEEPTFSTCRAYMNGYDDGTFRPSNLLSRAEACTVAARLLEDDFAISGSSDFTDVDDSDWYARYIGFCSEKGLLGAFGDVKKFEPTKPVTKQEFAKLIIDAYSKYGVGSSAYPKEGMIFDSAQDDIYAVFGSGDNHVSRGQAAIFINNITGRTSMTAHMMSEKYPVFFIDVTSNHPAYADIAEASISHVEAFDKWVYTLSDPSVEIENILGTDVFYNTSDGYAKIAELDKLEQQRINEIKNTPNMDTSKISGKSIYVSPNGNDSNSGLDEYNPVKTLAKANSLATSGDVVLLERGGEWREKIPGKKGVTYSAYSYGAKPILNGSPENGANQHKWTLVYENKETGALIWRYDREDWLDVGGIVFNGGEGYALKDLPNNISGSGKFTVYGSGEDYDYTVELDKNFEFFHNADSVMGADYIDCNNARGELYLRCDNGNPGKVFDSIEFITRGAIITCGGNTDVTIDNICFKYSNFGISSSTTKNLTVTNSEFYWIGGSVQTYSMRTGVATRYGNAIEIYGGVDGFLVDNCYFYEVYDAAVTHQVGNQDANLRMDNITYSNNVMDKCQYSIEYFFGGVSTTGAEYERAGTNVLFVGNLCRRAGYGFGSTRRDLYSQRHIRSGGSRNEFYNFRIEDNIFDRSVYELTQTTCTLAETKPDFDGNVYIQGVRNRLFSHSVGDMAYMDINAARVISDVLGDKNAEVYYVDNIPAYEWNFEYDKKVTVTDSDRE